MTHRILKEYIRGKKYDVEAANESLRSKCENCSERERAAEKAEREITDYYKAVYMADHIGEKYEGIISGVTAFAIFVTLPNGVEGSVRTDDLPFEFYYDDLRFTLVGNDTRYRIGDKVEITVVNSDIPARKVYFALSEYYESGVVGKEGYIEGVGNLNPLDVAALAEKSKGSPSRKGDSSKNNGKNNSFKKKNGHNKYARDHRPPKKKRK